VLVWVRVMNGVANTSAESASIDDVLRRRWLLEIERLGVECAFEDAAHVFALRFGCTVAEGRSIVLRAWRTLSLPPSPTH
jgi:hypothetical protein